MENKLITPQEFVDSARLWKGTPHHHQASIIHVGADCIGFPKGVVRDFGYDVSGVPTDYSRNSQPEVLLNYLTSSELVRRDSTNTLKMGRLALFYVYVDPKQSGTYKEPQHFGIITDTGWIHSHSEYGVVEVSLGKWVYRVHSVWVPVMLDEEAD